MKRRTFLQTTSTAAAATAASRAAAKSETKKPNLLILHCDELNFRTIGCYRDTLSEEMAFMWGKKSFVETPHIDRLAKEGVLFKRKYASTPVCSPSRSTLLTGQYSHQTGVTNNNEHFNDDCVTFAHLLGKAGYATGYSGKWHLDGGDKPGWAPKRNFGFEDNRYMFNRGHWKHLELTADGARVGARDAKGKPSYNVKEADEKTFATDWLCDRTLDFVEDHLDEPWVYMCSIPDPHGPDTVREPYASMFSDEHTEKPASYDKDAATSPSWAKPSKGCSYKMAKYHGMMKCIDDNVGKIYARLAELGQLDNTIVIFTADHGDMRGEHRRQNKGIPLEASAKVPFVVRFPDSIPAGSIVEETFSTTDFLPTMLGFLGVKTSGREEGRDLSPMMKGKAAPADWDDHVVCRSTGALGDSKGWIGAFTQRFKLILSDADEPWLIDLVEDPHELSNAIKDRPKVAAQLAAKLKSHGEKTKDPYLTDKNTRASLKALL